jgi:hypothetical protein
VFDPGDIGVDPAPVKANARSAYQMRGSWVAASVGCGAGRTTGWV